MTTDKYRVPMDELESETRVSRPDQVVVHGDGMGPAPVSGVGPVGDADGDGD